MRPMEGEAWPEIRPTCEFLDAPSLMADAIDFFLDRQFV